MTAQPHADPAAVQRRANKVARDVTALLATVEELTGERDRAVDAATALEQELAVKDEALAELRATADEWEAQPERYGRYPGESAYENGRANQREACASVLRTLLDSLAARLSAHLFPTDEACSSCGAPLDSLGCVPGEDGRPGHTTGGGCEANPTDEEGDERG